MFLQNPFPSVQCPNGRKKAAFTLSFASDDAFALNSKQLSTFLAGWLQKKQKYAEMHLYTIAILFESLRRTYLNNDDNF